jgi:hypothetical protein
MWWERGARRKEVAPIRPEAGIRRVLAWACCVRSKFSPHLAYSDGKRASGCSYVTLSTRRSLPAYSRLLVSLQATCSLCQAYGMHASRRQQQAYVWNAASGGPCVRHHGDHCDLSEVAAPNGVRLQPVGIIWVYPASPLTTGRRDVRGRPRYHCRVRRGSSSLRHRCAVCTAGLGNGQTLRLVQLAAREITAFAQPLQDPFASARSCVPLRVGSITTGVSHLHRADPSSGHQAPMLLRDAGGCDDGSATRCACSRAMYSLADSDPKARSALRIRKEGKSIASTGKRGWPKSANLCILSERLTLVAATSIGQSLLQLFVCCANNGATADCGDLSMLGSSMHASAADTATVQDCRQQAGRCSDRVDRVSVCASVDARECSCMCVCVRACVMCVRACVMPACAICACHVLCAYVWG